MKKDLLIICSECALIGIFICISSCLIAIFLAEKGYFSSSFLSFFLHKESFRDIALHIIGFGALAGALLGAITGYISYSYDKKYWNENSF